MNPHRYDNQVQYPPGLQQYMHPLPDCGETSYQGSNRLKGKKMLVTGGDSGIGRAVVIAYIREGAQVAFNYLPEEEKDALDVKKLLEDRSQSLYLIPGDLSDESFCPELVAKAVHQLGGLDNLTLVAGRQQYHTSIQALSSQELEKTFSVNVFSMFWLVQAALPHLSSGATITTTSSVQALNPSSHLLAYAATKAAITNFTKGLAKQLGPCNIRVNSVAPGPIWTVLQIAGGQPTENLATFGQQTPLERHGEPVEVAGVYVFLASDQASYVTGQIYGVTGGELS